MWNFLYKHNFKILLWSASWFVCIGVWLIQKQLVELDTTISTINTKTQRPSIWKSTAYCYCKQTYSRFHISCIAHKYFHVFINCVSLTIIFMIHVLQTNIFMF